MQNVSQLNFTEMFSHNDTVLTNGLSPFLDIQEL